MDVNELEKNDSENNNIINEVKENSEISTQNDDNLEILNKIFKKSELKNNTFIPILLKTGAEEILKIFTEKQNIQDIKIIDKFKDFILKKIKIISQINEISKNSPEILYIIFDYLSNQNISLFTYIIELYISFISLSQDFSKNETSNNNITIKKEIKKIFSYFISLGLLSQKVTDYIYQKIALFQLQKKLNPYIFNEIIFLLEIIYGIDNNISIKKNLIAKKYFYFYDREKSYIETTISEKSYIQINNKISIVIWFYLKETEEKNKSDLIVFKNDKGEKINVILNENNDIDIIYNDSITLNEKEDKQYNIKFNKWTQLRMLLDKEGIYLYLYQKNDEDKEKPQFIIKDYLINNKIIPNYSLYNCKIFDISFFRNFIGIVGTILFYIDISKKNNKDIEPIDSLYGLTNKNVNDFLSNEQISKGLGFILSPYLYFNNTIQDPISNIKGTLSHSDKKSFNLNSIFSFNNYIYNIFYLGGCNNFLPLFEIFYKLSLQENSKDFNIFKNIFNNLFKLLVLVFIEKEKNCILALQKEIHFFEILGIFMEKIDEKFYYDNEELLKILISIGKNYDLMKASKAIEESNVFFINIIFNPNIIIKFSLLLQIKYFNKIKNFSVLIPINTINKLLILLSRKYSNNEIEKTLGYSKALFDYIKIIFENIDVSDSCRESLFLLYKNDNNQKNDNKNISDYIFINIINVFLLYLDINKDIVNDINIIERRKQTVIYLLNSDNFFLENLLMYLSDTNIHIKKVIINFLRILTRLYGDLLDQYFEKQNRTKKSKRITKEEFYIFIKENIAPNYNNSKIKEGKNIDNNLNNKDSIFYLEDDKNNKSTKKSLFIEDLKNHLPLKRHKSLSNINKIKSSEIMKNISNILSEKPKILRKNSFKKIFINLKKDIKKEKKEEKKKENDNFIKIDELSDKKRKEIQETKLEIDLILFNWLLRLIVEKENNKEKKNDEMIEESIHHVIEYIVKFISYTKELEVIYRIIFFFLSQKNEKNQKKSDESNKFQYQTLLLYLCNNSLFIQFLIECLIHSYIYKNIYKNNKEEKDDDYIIIAKKKEDIHKLKLKFFNLIYEHSKEIFLDIYFYEKNNNRTEIMTKALNITLKLLIVFQDKNEIQKKNLLLEFLKQFFSDISETFDIRNKSVKRYYLNFINFFVDYSFILKNNEELSQKLYEKIKDDRTHCIPDFLIMGLIRENEQYIWAGKDIYKMIFNNLKQFFCIKNIFNNLEIIYKDINKEKKGKKGSLLEFKIDWVKSLINDIVYKKKNEEYYKIKTINGLFYTYPDGGYDNNFPIINIISLFNSLNLYLYYDKSNNNEPQEHLLALLDEIQNYIIFLLILSVLINPKDEFAQSQTYEEIQILIYKNLYFNIMNLKHHLNDKLNKNYYLNILHNIMLFLSVLYDIDQKEQQKKKNENFFKGLFFSNIDISNTAPIMLIRFCVKNSDKLFNEKNINFFLNNDKEKGIQLIEENITKNISENPSFDMYKIEIFEKVVKMREYEINNRLKLLIMKENEYNMVMNEYKRIYLKVKSIKNTLFFDEVFDNQQEILKIKSYRKLKKDLYSYNNSYSNLLVFYNMKEDKNPYYLKYKVSDFYSKDMSRKLIKPIMDINYYMPNFRKYKYESKKMYSHSNEEVYTVDLQIFENKDKYPLFPDIRQDYYKNKYYIQNNVCYVKTSNHIKGVLFHLNNEDNLNNNCLYFCMSKRPSEEIMRTKYEDYDSVNNSCYLSIFRNNMNKKDKDTYLKINFNEINFIFNRKYSFRDCSIEIYTSFHRSYYFKFSTSEKRNEFLEHIINILNKNSPLFKKLFKPIHSINEAGKKNILGYYKDIENNYEYSNINNIKEMWKNSKISTFEYLMWINIYGNRSFKDIAQYPVFPWIITDYMTKNFDDIINKGNIRNFKKPVGLFSLEEKGKERQEGYIDTFKFLSLQLKEDDIINFKIKEDDNDDELNEKKKINTDNNVIINEIDDVDNDNLRQNLIKIKDNIMPKIPQFTFNIEKIYKNISIEYEKIPYLFGSHFSNGMYVSHFMARLFPYSLTMIEIQGSNFDCAERLFICMQKTFSSASNEKCDLRELIPEFYYMPEFLMNVNKLNFGEIKIDNYFDSINYYDEIFEKNNKKEKIGIQDVMLPEWCKGNSYLFIIKKKELLENCILDLNSWIDLIFGYYQRGTPAQQIGNLYLPYCYDGVMNYRLKDEDLLNNREESEYKMRLFELGVNPTKVFDKKLLDKKKIIKQITNIKGEIDKKFGSFSVPNIKYIANINNNFNNLFLFSKNNYMFKITIEEKNELSGIYKIKDSENLDEISKSILYDKAYKYIIKILYKSNSVIFAGFYSGNIYLFSLEKNSKLNKLNSTIYSKLNNQDKKLLNNFGKGIITTLEISRDEKFIIWGNNKGSLIVLELHNKEKNIKLLKIISSHSGYSINNLSINSDLNLFADCSYDNYIHIYTLPRCEKIISLFNKFSDFYLDFIFLTAQPLASIILYSKQTTQFKCYNINGNDLCVKQNDHGLIDISKFKNKNYENMISPIIFTDWQFNDYLIYIFRYQFILLRKTPLMDLVFKINFNENEFISMICLSPLKDSIYVLDTFNKKVIIIHQEKCRKLIKNDKEYVTKNDDNIIEKE